MADPHVSRPRPYPRLPGTLQAGSYAFNATRGERERIGPLRMHANFRV
ncbi:MAG: hypothetical protein R3A46_04685 [Thermomicrobiales bacterium]